MTCIYMEEDLKIFSFCSWFLSVRLRHRNHQSGPQAPMLLKRFTNFRLRDDYETNFQRKTGHKQLEGENCTCCMGMGEAELPHIKFGVAAVHLFKNLIQIKLWGPICSTFSNYMSVVEGTRKTFQDCATRIVEFLSVDRAYKPWFERRTQISWSPVPHSAHQILYSGPILCDLSTTFSPLSTFPENPFHTNITCLAVFTVHRW